MDELVGFLRARLDEDAEAAEGVAEHLASGGRRGFAVDDLPGPICRHIFRHTPARVLADVAAKRSLLDEHDDVNDGSCGTCVDGHWGYPTHGGSSPQRFPCRTLRLLAAAYADHPEFKPEWKP